MSLQLPNLNFTPPTELLPRLEKLQQQLQQRDLDGCFILQDTDLFYFSGTIQRAHLFVPAAGEALLLVQKSMERAMVESSLPRIIQLASRRDIPDLLAQHGYRPRRLGLEMDVLPASIYILYQQLFPGVEIEDIAEDIRWVRAIKSSYEIQRIEQAAGIIDIMADNAHEAIVEGRTEIEVSGLLEAICRRYGTQGMVRVRGFNQYIIPCHTIAGSSGSIPSGFDVVTGGESTTPAVATGGGLRRLQRNEPIYVDCAIGIDGYLADLTRTFCLGRLPAQLDRAYHVAREIEQQLAAMLRPGASCADLYQAALQLASRAGLEDYFMGCRGAQERFVGHGIGLELNEYPVLTPGSATLLEAGMVIAIEPTFVFPEIGAVGIEDDYLITAAGCRTLSRDGREIIKL